MSRVVRIMPPPSSGERVAQTVEHVTFNHGVLGSIPSALTTKVPTKSSISAICSEDVPVPQIENGTGVGRTKNNRRSTVEESKRPDPVIEIYKGFRIEAYESDPGRWRVRIARVDGAKIKTFPDGDEHSGLNPPNEFLTAEKAIEWAKQIIDRGGDEQGIDAGGMKLARLYLSQHC
jgi:hypothetical protein